MVWLVHGANVLYLWSYVVKDIRRLRVLNILATIMLIAYYLMQPVPLVTAAIWNVVFIVLNLWRLYRYEEEKPVT